MNNIITVITLVITIACVHGCTTMDVNVAANDRIEAITGHLFYVSKEPDKEKVEIPVKTQTIRSLQLFDRKISYRNNKKASIEFELPKEIIADTKEIEMVLEVYNDDNAYLRAIWFEVDGEGGYIGTYRIAPGQVRGQATIEPKQRKKWRFNLSGVAVASDDSGVRAVDFSKMLRKPGLHTITCWISTYEQYGPNSWVSLELNMK